jgi:primosomal protein N' (replication factor Y)
VWTSCARLSVASDTITRVTEPAAQQPALPGMPVRRSRAVGAQDIEPAAVDPVARVVVDVPVPHLDRLFDYLVPSSMADAAQPGTRVKVRFGAKDVDGYVVERAGASEHPGTLAFLRRVVSAEPVLTAPTLALCRAVADHYAGTLPDVLRLAIPGRHARTEDAQRPAEDTPEPSAPTPAPEGDSSAWAAYAGGTAFVQHVQAGHAPRAVWTALPAARLDPEAATHGWAVALAQLLRACHDVARGAIVVLPDGRDVARLQAELEHLGLPVVGRGGGAVARLVADDGPAARYRSFLAALRGDVRIVIGTRAAAFAPVQELALVVCWDDADPNHREQRSPAPHSREVLALRSELEDCALLIGSPGRSAPAQALVAAGWVQEIVADRATVRARAPRVRALTSAELASEGAVARIPSAAWRLLRDGLERGPVLVQVPRKGYVPVVVCQGCREAARCRECHGPLGLGAVAGDPQCGWCGRLAAGWRCPECAGTRLRFARIGSDRTAEELGRAFPGATVRVSGASTGVLDALPSRPALVVATPGAEPAVAGGYAAAVLLDAALASLGMSMFATHDALHRWLSAAQLVRPSGQGGVVALVGDGDPAATAALVRWDPAGFAERDHAERVELGLPPAVRVASVTGDRMSVAAFLDRLVLPPGGAVLGPVELAPEAGESTLAGAPVRAIVRAPRGQGRALAHAVKGALGGRAARKDPGAVVVQLDPVELL